MSDFTRLRETEFRWSGQNVYLNAASWGPLPERSRAAEEEFHKLRQQGRLSDRDFVEGQIRARQALASLVQAQASEIALMPNTSAGLHLAAHFAAQRGRPGRRTIVLSEREFPANVYPWLALRPQGFEVLFVPVTSAGNPDEDALADALERPDVVAFSYSFVQFSTGFRGDLPRFGQLCRERDILFVVDAIQGLGAVPIDVRAAGIDVLASGAQKWLCSPWGTGFVYVRAELCGSLQPYLPGWLAFAASRDFTRLVDYDMTLRDDAQRFEVGSQPFQSCIALAESVELLLAADVACVFQHNLALQDRVIDWALRRGDVQVVSEQAARSGILSIRPPNAAAACNALLDNGISCAFREGSIRLSPHYYNNQSEIDRVLDILDGVITR
jgi:selenocysteine lyase/cysteine desulfurase